MTDPLVDKLHEHFSPARNNPFLGKVCTVCPNEILMLAFHGSGVCSEICRKVRDGVITPEQGDAVHKILKGHSSDH